MITGHQAGPLAKKAMERFIEVCCVSAEDVEEAALGGAKRVELCENLDVGGVTPSASLLEKVLFDKKIPVNVLVRPRGGDFVFSPDEERQMAEDILLCKKLGADGVVIGALKEDGSVDTEMTRRLVDIARPLSVTFHRAFDRCSEPFAALEEIIALGCDRLLTSGQEESSYDGKALIAELVRRADGRIVIMPGGGVRTYNIEELAAATKATEFHSTAHGADGRTCRNVVSRLAGNPTD